MKCPKCHYLSFEPEPRCRNCGYDLALAAAPDLELRKPESDERPPLDLTLKPSARTSSADEAREEHPAPRRVTLGAVDLDRIVGDGDAGAAPDRHATPPTVSEVMSRSGGFPSEAEIAEPPEKTGTGRPRGVDVPPLRVVPNPPADTAPREMRPQPVGRKRAPSTTAELPLFVKNRPQPDPDAPLVRVPSAPTPPIAVRRAQDVRRPAPKSASSPAQKNQLGPFEQDLLNDLQKLEARLSRAPARSAVAPKEDLPPGVTGRRLIAAAVDAALLGGISVAVLWTTLRLCDLGLGEWATLPLVPLGAFLLLVVAGYLLLFTVAGGQTVGKMLTGIRVVGEEDGRNGLTPHQAAVRALTTVPSVLMLGAGFVPAFVGSHLALHDRLSHTRVVPT